MNGYEKTQEVIREGYGKVVLSAFVKFHVWVLTAFVGFLATWVWATDNDLLTTKQQSQANTAAISVLPQIREDIAVLKRESSQQTVNQGKIEKRLDRMEDQMNRKLDEITHMLVDKARVK